MNLPQGQLRMAHSYLVLGCNQLGELLAVLRKQTFAICVSGALPEADQVMTWWSGKPVPDKAGTSFRETSQQRRPPK